ncbi:MAG: ATPase, T2SS/T4P/T4SS family, partial [Raoultibacter sp.]
MNTSQDQDYVQEDIFEEDEYLFEEDDSDRSVDIRNAIHEELLDAINLMDEMPGEDKVREIVTELVEDYPDVILESEQKRYINDFIDDILKLGPLESYLRDPEVTEIMVNGANLSYVERNGELEEVDMHWRSEEHVKAIADRILSPIKRSISAASPIADGRLTDPPARVHIITAPCSILGTVITIRKFRDMKSAEDLLASETATPEMFEFLRASVQSKRNILVSGRNNSGKTTMLNVATSFIPAHERIITIEDAAELKLGHLHVVPLESKPPNREGAGAVEIKELVKSTLRMRPDRV